MCRIMLIRFLYTCKSHTRNVEWGGGTDFPVRKERLKIVVSRGMKRLLIACQNNKSLIDSDSLWTSSLC